MAHDVLAIFFEHGTFAQRLISARLKRKTVTISNISRTYKKLQALTHHSRILSILQEIRKFRYKRYRQLLLRYRQLQLL